MKEKRLIMLGDLNPNQKFGGQIPRNQNRVYSANGVCPCIYSTYAQHFFKIKDER